MLPSSLLRAGPAAALALLFAAPALADVPNVVASIKPLHSLTAAVMAGVGEPALLLDSNVSPHTYALRPSDARKVAEADLVVWVGPGVEGFLDRTLDNLAGSAAVFEATQVPGLTLLPYREGGLFEPHTHGEEDDHDGHSHEGHDHSHEGSDAHVWLDPANGERIVAAIADELAALDPDNADRYRANAQGEIDKLKALREDVAATAEPVAGRPFLVFHDAFQYFEHAFGVTAIGSLTISPEVAPGARRIAEVQQRLADNDVRCLVAEPQFPREMVELLAGEDTRIAVLDEVGIDIPAGPDMYAALIRQNAQRLAECLAGPA